MNRGVVLKSQVRTRSLQDTLCVRPESEVWETELPADPLAWFSSWMRANITRVSFHNTFSYYDSAYFVGGKKNMPLFNELFSVI